MQKLPRSDYAFFLVAELAHVGDVIIIFSSLTIVVTTNIWENLRSYGLRNGYLDPMLFFLESITNL